MNNSKIEYENKFVVPNFLAGKLKAWLDLTSQPDSQHPGGVVNSIYFDTRSLHLLREKVNSDYLKTKVRIRWYSDSFNSEPVKLSFLEVKNRQGAQRFKLRFEDAIKPGVLNNTALSKQLLLQVNQCLHSEGIFLQDNLLPVMKIQYLRNRYLDRVTGSRISIDRDIRISETNPLMLPSQFAGNLKNAVFELKGADHTLPANLHQLTAFGCRKSSFSKYSECYNHIKRNVMGIS